MSRANKIYLDYAATTPVSERAFKAMQPYFSDIFYNPSSLHIPGQKARGVLDIAHEEAAYAIGADASAGSAQGWKEIIFTSSATESINLVLRGIIKACIGLPGNPIKTPHIITTNIEHSAVLKTCHDLERDGVEITYLPVNKDGLISPKQVEEAIKENTVLVSIGYVNNEIGTIQPISAISKIVSNKQPAYRTGRQATSNKYPYFHTDAVQAANYLDINVKNLGVDLMTLSSHKIYGPKGAALLYKKDNVKLTPVITGGDQERGYHSGTENIPAIVGFTEALKEVQEKKQEESKRLRELQNFFIEKVLSISNGSGITLNGSRENRIFNNINFCFADKNVETLIPALDKYGIYASGGSACTSRTPEPSHVIEAIEKKDCSKGSIRFTLGRHTTKQDLEYVADKIKEIVRN